ncbi:GNAT family N-acetyltransferase [Kitasatospora sp. MAP5-34]|uniref:GNAT family N-acetyltransferase n=1 Tax=Kitasatospora sp. MAP5-34 TaxID=3035102 RepID=UPI002476AEBD|nr:GNAT family N-acetyltransferase [Kitasatospora sp. MAP5-34]
MSHVVHEPVAPVSTSRPPEVIALPGGVSLRRRAVGDAPALNAAVNSCLEHLRPWMPWAKVESTLGHTEQMVEAGVASWDAGTDFMYLVTLDAVPGSVIGAFGLHSRAGEGTLEIGYWVHADHTGRGIATASADALTAAALALPGIERVEIHCDEANHPSSAVPRKLGYRLDRVIDAPVTAPAETGRKEIWIAELPTA